MTRTLAFITIFAALVGAVLWMASAALSRATERTVTYQYIADALDDLSARPNHVTWQAPVVDLVRPVTPGDEAALGLAMTEAWSVLALAQDTGDASILRDSFSGVAQERAERSVLDANAGGQMVVLSQEARPQFYHLDGSVFQAEVLLQVARYVAEGDDLAYFELVEDRTVTTLLNETNGWRIYAHERKAATPITPAQPGWVGAPLAGLNYYPAATPWRDFWPAFDENTIAQDFARITDLRGNAVRVFLTADYFAAPDTQQAALDRLATLLSLAEDTGLQVMPTLFDLKPTFDPASWARDYAALQAVLPVLAASPAVTMVDLKNEPDLDFATHGRPQILAWLTTMATLARAEAPELALTIGWSSSDAALELEDFLDVVSYHDYADLSTAKARLEAVQAATSRPVMVTEIGVTSYSMALGLPSSRGGQADDLAARLQALSGADGLFVWTLYDFPNVDATAVGASPWVQRLQARFGLFTADGTAKPAADVVRLAFEQLTKNRD
ncbi:MAG: hypothetical protein KJP02_00455 [Octadecabacter sp.]|nr:hypothetical protein [Octadecabacter sp.]